MDTHDRGRTWFNELWQKFQIRKARRISSLEPGPCRRGHRVHQWRGVNIGKARSAVDRKVTCSVCNGTGRQSVRFATEQSSFRSPGRPQIIRVQQQPDLIRSRTGGCCWAGGGGDWRGANDHNARQKTLHVKVSDILPKTDTNSPQPKRRLQNNRACRRRLRERLRNGCQNGGQIIIWAGAHAGQ